MVDVVHLALALSLVITQPSVILIYYICRRRPFLVFFELLQVIDRASRLVDGLPAVASFDLTLDDFEAFVKKLLLLKIYLHLIFLSRK